MSTSRHWPLLLVLVPAIPVNSRNEPPKKQPTPREIIRRAVDAQGGEKQVARLVEGPWRAKVKGKTGILDLDGEMLYSRAAGRMTTNIYLGPIPMQVVVVNKDDKFWMRAAGATHEATGKELEEAKDGGYRSRKVRFLLPLLKEPGFDLSLLPETKVTDRPAAGVRVKSAGHRDVDLYFDNGTGLLTKIESRIFPPGKTPIVLEQVVSDYRDFDGVKLGTKCTKYENKRLTSVEEWVDLKFVDEFDEHEFDKP